MSARRLAATWVLPVDRPPIARGAVLLDETGRIAAVGSDHEVPAPPGVPAECFAGAAIIPGLVNAHTHLELTGFGGLIDEPEFPEWIRRLRELKATRTRAEYLAAAREGVASCHAAGVTTVADTGDSGAVIQALAEMGGRGVCYHEVFGPHPSQCADSLAALEVRIAELRQFTSDRVRLGVSPHAPYSVSGPLYRSAAAWARREHLPLAVHLAESEAETRLLRDASGPFAEMWVRRGIPLPPPPGRSPVAWLDEHGVLGPDTLCIHVVQADATDVGVLRARGAAVAHCPLSNRWHGHGRAPLDAFLAAGLRVGVGTDSVASVGRLDLLAEARAARQLAGIAGEQALELCTLGGARALGLAGEIGSLTEGKWGDVAVVRVDGGPEGILDAAADAVLTTFVAGREVFRAG